jgi:5-methyltetrahydropteroyltriglutamate--homocysteine methyltransferase
VEGYVPPATGHVRAETAGSLLRPRDLLAVRHRQRAGEASESEARAAEDQAILQAIELQESLGLDVITDGEMRRTSWISTVRGPLDGFDLRPGGPGWQWRGTAEAAELSTRPFPFVVRPIRIRYDLAEREYAFLHRRARVPTKYCVPAPSYHRTVWHPQHSREAYPRCEDFLVEMRDVIRRVIQDVVAMGCEYVQLDAPNYGNLCDPGLRAAMASTGRNLDAELEVDLALDNSVLQGLGGVTTAVHVCRGNAAGNWAASGGYGVIAERLFGGLRVDRLLLEYDTPRAGGFEALRHVRPETTVVLGLVTTKSGALEDPGAVEARIREASAAVPLERLALSPQCGFASVEWGNPISPAEQEAKLRLVVDLARRVWPPSPLTGSAP